MFDLHEEPSPSEHLLYTLTQEYHMLQQAQHMQAQNELMLILAENKKHINDENSFERSLEQATEEAEAENSKTSLLSDCRIRRIQEEDQVLREVQKKCGVNCHKKVKEFFNLTRRQQKTIRQLESRCQVHQQAEDQALRLKKQNERLKEELSLAVKKLGQVHDQKGKMRVLEEKNMNRESSVLRAEKQMLFKEKRLSDMRRKIAGLLEEVGREVCGVDERIREFNDNLGQLDNVEGIGAIVGQVQTRAEVVQQSWKHFAQGFKAKLQQQDQ